EHGDIQYLVFDYLAELTMSLLAGARLKNPESGYATDFVTSAMAQVLPQVVSRNIKVITNAGGVNPRACAQALEKLAQGLGLKVRIAVVLGDDVMPLLPALRDRGVRQMYTGESLPGRLVSANAYLGAAPIAKALDAGAQIVITGRCVDSAVTLGALMHEFGWNAGDWDRLAAASLAGHIIECGCQATGGLHTDWQSVPDWAHIGYPVVECYPDGSFTVCKPEGTGGLISRATVGEQLLYEIGDPSAYLLPDVTCDFRGVTLAETGPDRVLVSGAKGRAPGPQYKVTATYPAGFRCNGELLVTGFDAAAKAQRSGEALLRRVRDLLQARGLADFSDTHIDVIGAERCYGPHASDHSPRQAVMRVAVTHPEKAALELFAKEVAAAGTSWAPGTSGLGGGRPSVAMSIRQFPFLVDKSLISAVVEMDGKAWQVPGVEPATGSADAARPGYGAVPEPPPVAAEPGVPPDDETLEVPLITLAYGRSGDKGDISNIGIMARHERLLPVLRAQLTDEAVRSYLSHLVNGAVTRYELPGIGAFNFVCEEALGGGGMASLRSDALGKGMAQILLSMPVQVSGRILRAAAT
ncbi:MAG: terpene utilization protein AtuA, partial [Ramlibacter sp.]|nr:terpene utilization protein AtuA [Ramlibacter sp.]